MSKETRDCDDRIRPYKVEADTTGGLEEAPKWKGSEKSGKTLSKLINYQCVCVYIFSLTSTNSSPHKSHFGNLSFKVRKDISDFSYLT